MNSLRDIGVFLNQSEDQLEECSSTIEMLERLEDEIEGDFPDGFFEEVSPRDPSDVVILRGSVKQTNKSEWKDESELRDIDFHRSEFSELPEGSIPVDEFSDITHNKYNSIVSQKYDSCSECAGNPESVCDTCDGDTTYDCERCNNGYKPCAECNGDGTNSCDRCTATGEIMCSTCEGTPHSACDSCDGTGSKTIQEACPNCSLGKISVKETCSQCQGQGAIKEDGEFTNCPRCSGVLFGGNGKVRVEKTCTQCSGKGSTRRNITCDECTGTGKWECPECSTTGSIRCPDCDGREVIVCDSCGGDGEMACTNCNAHGEHNCEDCQDGIRVCSVCGGDGDTHNIVFRRTSVMWKQSENLPGRLPYGVENPDWIHVEPHIVAHRNTEKETTVCDPSTIDMELVGSSTYEKIDVKYVLARILTYDYGERNFTVREVNGSLYYSNYPSIKKDGSGGNGLFSRLKSMF